jgi:anhydro-N-acetylmuramic acid kinase
MNPNIARLCAIAQKSERIILGLMSGTSLDGLDLALCRFGGSGMDTGFELLHFHTVAYGESVKREIRKVFAKPSVDFQLLTLLHAWLGRYHGTLVNHCLHCWGLSPHEVDLIASHGQTVYHAPKILHQHPDYPNATLQIGDGDHLAITTGIITISDFRQKHVAAGGEGAPLAAYGDVLLLGDEKEHRILLNIGGIANFTWLPAGKDTSEVFVTDTGPGNTLLDAAVRHYYPDKAFDENGEIAGAGRIDPDLLRALKSDDFFGKPSPKTTGPELFNLDYLRQAQQKSNTEQLIPPDILATLTQFSAETIADCIRSEVAVWQDACLYASGGGAHNPVLLTHLSELLPGCPIHQSDELGISADAKEAVLFALLANEAVAGSSIAMGKFPAISMGKVSFPF